MESVILKAMTREELATEYNISIRTLYRWLKEAEIKLPRGLIKPSDLRIIYDTFGYPEEIKTA